MKTITFTFKTPNPKTRKDQRMINYAIKKIKNRILTLKICMFLSEFVGVFAGILMIAAPSIIEKSNNLGDGVISMIMAMIILALIIIVSFITYCLLNYYRIKYIRMLRRV